MSQFNASQSSASPMAFNDPSFWDTFIANYEANSHPFTSHFAEEVLARVEVGPGTRVLDVATGAGALALPAAQRGADVTAIDFSPGMIRKVQSYSVPNIAAHVMDGQALDLPNNAYDVVISIFGVMLFPDFRAGLREMARVTRPGGWVAVATWKNPSGAAVSLLLMETLKKLEPEFTPPFGAEGMQELRDPQRFAAALEAVGLAAPVIEEVTHPFLLKLTVLEHPERLGDLMPFWNTLEPERQGAVLQDLRARAETEAVGDALPVPSTALIGIARKP